MGISFPADMINHYLRAPARLGDRIGQEIKNQMGKKTGFYVTKLFFPLFSVVVRKVLVKFNPAEKRENFRSDRQWSETSISLYTFSGLDYVSRNEVVFFQSFRCLKIRLKGLAWVKILSLEFLIHYIGSFSLFWLPCSRRPFHIKLF